MYLKCKTEFTIRFKSNQAIAVVVTYWISFKVTDIVFCFSHLKPFQKGLAASSLLFCTFVVLRFLL